MADVFEEGIVEGSQLLLKKNQKIRLGKEREIARHVAQTGETINIRDAYNDARFNKQAVDEKSGLITRSILCMAVKSIDGILGKSTTFLVYTYS